jgi:hypothetical protein
LIYNLRIMSPSFTIDFSDDFDVAPAAAAAPVANGAKSSLKRNLLVAPPSVAAHEEKLRDVFMTFDRSATDIQMLDRLSAGLVHLPPATYDLVVVLTNTDDQQSEALRLLTRNVFTALVPAMKSGATLQLQNGTLGAVAEREAILAGLMPQDGAYVKVEEEEVVVPLRFGAKKRQQEAAPQPVSKPLGVGMVDPNDDLGEYEDGDELIDEDELLGEEDLKRPQQQRKISTLCPPSLRRFTTNIANLSSYYSPRVRTRARPEEATTGLQRLHLRSGRATPGRGRDTQAEGDAGSPGTQATVRGLERTRLYRAGQDRFL